MLKINNLKKFYGNHLALHIGDVEFGEGLEFHHLIGNCI